jgi:hypothetical protein
LGGALGWDGLLEASDKAVGALEEGGGAVWNGLEGERVWKWATEEGEWRGEGREGEENDPFREDPEERGGHPHSFADAVPD